MRGNPEEKVAVKSSLSFLAMKYLSQLNVNFIECLIIRMEKEKHNN